MSDASDHPSEKVLSRYDAEKEDAFHYTQSSKWQSQAIARDAPGETHILSGNEALARGAIEAGVQVATTYPGTPTTYMFENLAAVADEFDMYTEYSNYERTAYEVAAGAAFTGVRATTISMCHGLNLMMDPVHGDAFQMGLDSLVIVSGDEADVNTHRHEQHSPELMATAEVPSLEPTTFQECKDFVVDAFELSEKEKYQVLVTIPTRLAFGRGPVEFGEIDYDAMNREPELEEYVEYEGKKYPKWLKGKQKWPADIFHEPTDTDPFGAYPSSRQTPAMRYEGELKKGPHTDLVEAVIGEKPTRESIQTAVNEHPANDIRTNPVDLALLGVSEAYSEASDALQRLGNPDSVSLSKVAFTYPIPEGPIKEMLRTANRVLVVENSHPWVEDQVRVAATELDDHAEILGKNTDHLHHSGPQTHVSVGKAVADLIGDEYEYRADPDRLQKGREVLMDDRIQAIGQEIETRFCAGCPEFPLGYAAKRALRQLGLLDDVVWAGDQGCTSHFQSAPFDFHGIRACMGAGPGLLQGVDHVGLDRPVVAYLGDGAFFHSALPSIMNATYNQANLTLLIVDNRAIANTGGSPHPGAGGVTASGGQTKILKINEICDAIGVDSIETVDPMDVDETVGAIKNAVQYDGVSVVISQRICQLVDGRAQPLHKPYKTEEEDE